MLKKKHYTASRSKTAVAHSSEALGVARRSSAVHLGGGRRQTERERESGFDGRALVSQFVDRHLPPSVNAMPSAVSPTNAATNPWHRPESRTSEKGGSRGGCWVCWNMQCIHIAAASVVQDTLEALVDDVKATTEVLRRRHFDTVSPVYVIIEVNLRSFVVPSGIGYELLIHPKDYIETYNYH